MSRAVLNPAMKRAWSILVILSLVLSMLGIAPSTVHANQPPSKVVLVGNLQTKLGHDKEWDPAADATEMTATGDGEYRLTGVLPAGTYEYKIAIDGNWNESYGFDNYSNRSGAKKGDNIEITLDKETEVTFYYHHGTHRIADSTYYKPLAADKLPRVIGSFQTGIGEAADWSASDARLLLQDTDYDDVYTVTADVYGGDHEYQIALGADSAAEVYPANKESLKLPEDAEVTFTYNALNHSVSATYQIPQQPADPADPIPADHVRVHYKRMDGNYRNMGLWIFGDVSSPSANWPAGATPFPDGQVDQYGAFVDIPLKADAKKVGIVVVDRVSGSKDGGDKNFAIASPEMNEVWLKEGSDTVYPYEPVDLPADTVRVHYQRQDGNYSSYGLWLWGDVAAPSENWPAGATMFPAGQTDRYGAYLDIPMKPDAQKINFIVLDPSKGDAGKDGGDRGFALVDRYQHLFLKEGDSTVYVSPYGEVATGLVSAEVLAPGKLRLGFTMTDGLEAGAVQTELQIRDKGGSTVNVGKVSILDGTTIEAGADFTLDQVPLQVTYAGKTVTASTGWRMLDEMYAYDGDDLGAAYQGGGAVLKLWAPTADNVTVNVYDKGDATQLVGNVPLHKGDRGVWSAELRPGDLGIADFRGYYYQYEVTNQGVTKKVLDPYAKSMAEFRVNTKGEAGPDGDTVGKAAIVDLSGTDPAGFDFADIPGYEQREDAIIWEIHVRDFTSDPSIEHDLNNATWGSYDAFKEKLAYIKSLGVTHVQLLPVMAWYYGDETAMKNRELEYSAKDNEYNWGYDPHSYFSPDGAYSENPADPELRIKELKAMIHAIHEADMGVVLDVVYTHMAKADFLNDIVPNYYAFQDANGNFIGGFGNNLATNRKMAEKLMVDSVKYWFEEYKIDGMRWDMMGDATYEAVQHAYDAAAAINPNALFIGEGWVTFGGHLSDPSLAGKGADQNWMDKTDDVGVFSDEFRNELKSGFGHEGEPRFITGGARDIQTIFNNIKAQPSNTKEDDPGDIVQYIEAHDNLPLYDIIAQSIKKDPSDPANDSEIHKRIRLGNLITLTSQGTAFLHAGQEYGRTKQWKGQGVPEQKYHELFDENGKSFGYFIHDSYDSSDAINMFDWVKATDEVQFPENNKTREYTTGLIELRKSSDAFRLGDRGLVDSNVTLLQIPEVNAQDLVIAYKNKATDGTGSYYVFVNADNRERSLTLGEDLTSGQVLVDDDEAGTSGVTSKSGFTLTSGSITLEPLTAVVIKMNAATNPGGNDGGSPGAGSGSGSGSGDGGAGGIAPPTNPSKPQQPESGQRIISDDMLKSGQGSVTIGLQAGDKEILLPLQAGDLLGSKTLELNREGLVVRLPASLLSSLQKLLPAGQEKNAVISFTLQEIAQQNADAMTSKAASSVKAKIKRGSTMFDVQLAVKLSDGTEYKPEAFASPITFGLALEAGINAKWAGIYRIAADGALTYIGGKPSDGLLTGQLNQSGIYAAYEYDKSFADLVGRWAEQAVKELAAKHIVNGTSESTFSPKQPLTRAQFAAMLARALHLEADHTEAVVFRDVDSSAWYASAVAAASQHGLVNGRGNGMFAPDAAVTRQEMAAMLLRAYEANGTAPKAPAPKDQEQISAWAAEMVEEALAHGLMKGRTDGNFAPKDAMTRAESAQAILNLLSKRQ